jgi:hypothetical protein
MMLPKQRTAPKQNPTALSVLLYGASKVGKSGWCSQAPRTLFLATVPGLNHLDVYQVPIRSWEELLGAARELAKGDHDFDMVAVDTVDVAYRLCSEHICRKLQVDHPGDAGFGKGHSLVNGEFARVLTRLAQLNLGLYLISHAQQRELDARTGKVTRIVPTLPDRARDIATGLVDVILYFDVETVTGPDGKPVTRRVLRTKPSPHYDAGDRTGRLPDVLDASFESFMAAFQKATNPVTNGGSR